MKKFVTVCFLGEGLPAEFAEADWPFHVTLLPSFETELPLEELENRLKLVAARHAPIEVQAKSREMFGASHDVPVTEVHATPALAKLRADLACTFGSDVTYPAPPFPNYRPHVTDQHGVRLPVGAVTTLGSVSLVEKVGERRVVTRTGLLTAQ